MICNYKNKDEMESISPHVSTYFLTSHMNQLFFYHLYIAIKRNLKFFFNVHLYYKEESQT